MVTFKVAYGGIEGTHSMLLGRSEQGFIYVFEEPVRILAVDDDPIMREMAMAQLSHPGGEIVTAENGQEAWDILAGDAAFDLVLSDLEMPQMTGFGLCAAIREDARLARLPVVVLTGRDDMFAIDRAYEVGATAFATKPVNWRMLGYQLRYVLRNRRDNEAALAAVAEPDHATCLRILLAKQPAEMAAIARQVAGIADAGAILRRYADLLAAHGTDADDIRDGSSGSDTVISGSGGSDGAGGAESGHDDPGAPVDHDPVAEMRALLGQARRSMAGRTLGARDMQAHDAQARDDAEEAGVQGVAGRNLRFLASGGR